MSYLNYKIVCLTEYKYLGIITYTDLDAITFHCMLKMAMEIEVVP